MDKFHPAYDRYKCDFVNNAIQNSCRIEYLHTSGHASADEIRKVCKITNAKTVIPIHSEVPELLNELNIASKIIILQDNEILTI